MSNNIKNIFFKLNQKTSNQFYKLIFIDDKLAKRAIIASKMNIKKQKKLTIGSIF